MNLLETPANTALSERQYQYDELPRRSIRLFQLNKTIENVLELQISTHKIDDEMPDYIALSYTWEPRFPLHIIQVNNSDLTIGHNLWEGLTAIADENQGILFWVDQICINQSMKGEVNHQVQIMSEIYNRAKTVLIWLGAASGSENVIAWISYVGGGNRGPPSERCTCQPIKIKYDRQNLSCYMHFTSDYSGMWSHRYNILEPIWNQVTELLERHYWSRVWVVQEISFARNVLIQYGHESMTWQELQLFLQWTHQLCLTFTTASVPGMRVYPPAFTDIRSVKSQWGLGQDWKPAIQDLSLVLETCRNFQCTLKLDKIYGLFGLVDEAHRVEVDYDQTTEALFHALILKVCGHHGRAEAEPAWTDLLGMRLSGYRIWKALEGDDSGIHLNEALEKACLAIYPDAEAVKNLLVRISLPSLCRGTSLMA